MHEGWVKGGVGENHKIKEDGRDTGGKSRKIIVF